MSGLQLFLAVVNAISEISPHALPEVPPAQFVDQLAALVAATNALEHGIAYFSEAEHTVADVRRQPGDGAFEVIAAFGVTPWVETRQFCFGCCSTSAQWTETAAGFRKLFAQQAIEGSAVRKIPGKISRLFWP